MHDLIRLYAAGRAEVEPGADDAWQRLIGWYLRTTDAASDFEHRPLVRLTERIFDENPFADAAQAGAWLEAEEQNLVACITRAADSGPYGDAWRLADVLRQYYSRHDRVGPWRQAATAGLRAALAAGDRDGEGAMRHSLGALAFTAGEPAVAIAESAKACEAYAEAGFKLGEAALLCNLGMAHDDHGESVQAAEFLMKGIRAFRSLGRIGTLWPALHSLSNVSHNLGELDAAVAAASEALEIAPDGYAGVVGLLNRGAAYRLLGELDRSEADMTTALAMEDRPSSPGQYEIALLYADLGRYDEAAVCADAALEISRRDSLEFHEATALNTLGLIRRGQGRWDEAARQHADARDIAVRLGHRATEAEALLGLAAVALARAELTEALDLGQQARDLAGQLRQRIVECRAVLLLAETNRQAGRSEEAERLIAEAAAIQSGTGYRKPIAAHHH
jgi:tetratricopeptide (TPR) repeat protein